MKLISWILSGTFLLLTACSAPQQSTYNAGPQGIVMNPPPAPTFQFAPPAVPSYIYHDARN